MIVAEIKTNFKSVNDSLSKIVRDLNNLVIPLKQSGMIMMRSIDTNFRQQGRPDKWKALKPSTIKRRRGGSSTVLQDIGTLKGSFALKLKGKDSVAVGTSVKYAAVHNFGLTTTRNKALGRASKSYRYSIPKRPFMLFQEKDKKLIDEIFLKFMGKTLTRKTVRIG